jgi:hypothetical protein
MVLIAEVLDPLHAADRVPFALLRMRTCSVRTADRRRGRRRRDVGIKRARDEIDAGLPNRVAT